ncbi:hypothetical protein [Caballeronia sp. GAFFF2]|uniref:hypothetical protein n=1 Tax=Caballeronia sp. GAFFF2 TaxID=2921741 RepID=UPI0020294750|nr:hypothetical protein [Caballeronia sp. GAFFF2]
MNESNFDLPALLAELRDARAFAEHSARDLRAAELKIENLRNEALAALRVAKERSSPSAQREEVGRGGQTPRFAAVSISVRSPSRVRAGGGKLESVVQDADASGQRSGAAEAARLLRNHAESLGALRQLAQAAARNNRETIASLLEARAAAALM